MAALFKIVSICKGGHYHFCRTVPKHPRANAKGLYPLHRVRMENKLGRLLGSHELVHHRDHDRNNDSVRNLAVTTRSEHARHHNPPSRMSKLRAIQLALRKARKP